MQNIEDIVNETDYFECKKMHARHMPKATCIARQKANREKPNNPPYSACMNCSQREKIIMESTALCKDCGKKPPISKNAPYCASCMAICSNKARKAKNEAIKAKPHDMAPQGEISKQKSPQKGDREINIDFGTHVDVLERIKKLADEELRTVENQIIYILKTYPRTAQGAETSTTRTIFVIDYA